MAIQVMAPADRPIGIPSNRVGTGGFPRRIVADIHPVGGLNG